MTPHSKNARQWHFIRAEGSSNGSWRSRRALQPTSLSRRALQPTSRSRRAGCSESARGILIVVSSFGIARLYLVVSGIGIETRGSLDAVKEIGQDGMWDRCNRKQLCVSFPSFTSSSTPGRWELRVQLREPLRQDETACHGSPSGVSGCG